MKIITIFGAPGSGKGTQATNLVQEYGLVHIATGDIFRHIVKTRTDPLALHVRSIIDAGRLVPDELTIRVLQEAIEQNPSKKGYVFDGFPRTLPQYQMFMSFLSEKFPDAEKIYLYFSVKQDELIRRILGRAKIQKRNDDTLQTIKKRIFVYRHETEPVIEILHKKGVLETVHGTGKTIPEVWAQVKEIVQSPKMVAKSL